MPCLRGSPLFFPLPRNNLEPAKDNNITLTFWLVAQSHMVHGLTRQIDCCLLYLQLTLHLCSSAGSLSSCVRFAYNNLQSVGEAAYNLWFSSSHVVAAGTIPIVNAVDCQRPQTSAFSCSAMAGVTHLSLRYCTEGISSLSDRPPRKCPAPLRPAPLIHCSDSDLTFPSVKPLSCRQHCRSSTFHRARYKT